MHIIVYYVFYSLCSRQRVSTSIAAIFRMVFDGNINVFWSYMVKSGHFIEPDGCFLYL